MSTFVLMVSTPAFVDSMSDTNVINEKLFRKCGLELIPNSSIQINQLQGSAQTLGLIKACLKISDRTFTIKAHVVKGFEYPLLIGINDGGRFGIHLDLSSRTAYWHTRDGPTVLAIDSVESKLKSILDKHKLLFSQSESDIGRISIAKHKIVTVPCPPIQVRYYRRPQSEYDEIHRQVKELLSKGLIRESKSPWASPVLLVKKKDNSNSMCIDYRPLNEVTIDDKMPMPRIDDIIDRLRGAHYFTTLDVAWGYWHIEMSPDSVEKTAFVTNEGHFEWLVMPFGLKNAPATFQRIVQQILHKYSYKGVINYLDDIIIYSENYNVHLNLLNEIFQILREHNVKLRLKKCLFAQTEVQYLGHLIGHNSVKPSPEKIKAIN